MKKKALGILLTVAMTATMLAGCGDNAGNNDAPSSNGGDTQQSTPAESTPAENNGGEDNSGDGLAFTGTISLMHYSTSEESQGNGSSDGIRTMIANWDAAHPGILDENVMSNDDYKTQIATLAAAGDLPDVFMLQGMNTAAWADQGLILDLTDIIAASPDSANYDTNLFGPFTTADGKIYALPTVSGGTCTVVIYDKSVWGDTFPSTWAEVEEKAAEIIANGQTPIAFGNGGQWQANSCFISSLGDRYTGEDWFWSLVNKEGAKFTDDVFVAALAETQRLFTQTDLFNKDFNAVTNEDAREYYIDHSAAAFIGGNWDASYIGATLKENGDDLYNNTGFAVLPQSADAGYQRNSQNGGFGYGVAINAKLADDPEKLAVAIDLAYTLAGREFAEYVASHYALGGLVKVSGVDFSAFDQWDVDFYNFSYVDTATSPIYDSFINGAVWGVLNEDMQAMLNGSMTPEDVAANAQAAYDANY